MSVNLKCNYGKTKRVNNNVELKMHIQFSVKIYVFVKHVFEGNFLMLDKNVFFQYFQIQFLKL